MISMPFGLESSMAIPKEFKRGFQTWFAIIGVVLLFLRALDLLQGHLHEFSSEQQFLISTWQLMKAIALLAAGAAVVMNLAEVSESRQTISWLEKDRNDAWAAANSLIRK